MKRLVLTTVSLAMVLLTSACAVLPTVSDADDAPPDTRPSRFVIQPDERVYPPAPVAPSGAADAATRAFDELIDTLTDENRTSEQVDLDIEQLIETGDARHAWLLSDLLRFMARDRADLLVDGFAELSGVDLSGDAEIEQRPWAVVTNHLIAWGTPAPPDYQRLKARYYTRLDEQWSPMFDDADAAIDWRWISWRGALADGRPLGETGECERRCIPALDDPPVIAAQEATWYADQWIVFGITEGSEAVAFPENMMEVHELVNITIGGRRFGIPYCSLCRSAQAFYTDRMPDGVDNLVLRDSGLVNRSNKVIFDLATNSAFDTFTGAAVTGPLLDAGVMLDQNTVRVTTWGDWKAAHPNTTIVARDGGIGRVYTTNPLRGRDDEGPIYPVGDIDQRLGAVEPVLGVSLDDGTTLAFTAADARSALAGGDTVELQGVTVASDGGGLVASVDGVEIGAQEASWFAWSQFHADTLLWPLDS